MKEKIKLSNNHNRVISVIMKIIEKKADEIIEVLNNPKNEITYQVVRDIEKSDNERKLKAAYKLKKIIKQIFTEYNLQKEVHKQSQIINSKKINLWSLLNDAYSNKLNNYGKFNPDLKEKYDMTISELINIIEEL